MKIINLLEEKFWIPLSFSLLLGLFFPFFGKQLSILIIPLFMMIFFLTCLKIDFLDVIKHIKKLKFIIYILVFYLLVIPCIFYFLFTLISSEVALGVLLLTAVPPGTVSPVLTDMFKGNTPLSMSIALTSYLVSPFTIVLLFILLTKTTIHIDLMKLFQTLLFINFIPLVVAQLIRNSKMHVVEKTKKHFGLVNIACMSLIIYIVVAMQAKEILQKPFAAFVDTFWLYVLFIALFLIAYFVAFWKKKTDKIAIAVTKTYMNNALAISVAAAYFDPKIALFIVLSEIPWATTLGFFKYITKYLK